MMYECHEHSFKFHINHTTTPSLMSRNLIHFNFFLKTKIKNYIQISPSSLCFVDEERLPETFASHVQKFSKSSCIATMRASLHEALSSLSLSGDVCTISVEKAVDELRHALKTEPLCRSGRFMMDIDLKMKVTYDHIHQYDMYGYDDDMVPAEESSVRLLLDDVDCVDVKDENCCICFEEFSDGGRLLLMPCEHVFHGGCIEKWLRNSHYCPLCRFEMPT